jgi:hypothetical protein
VFVVVIAIVLFAALLVVDDLKLVEAKDVVVVVTDSLSTFVFSIVIALFLLIIVLSITADADADADVVDRKADNVAIFRSGDMVLIVGLRRRNGDTGP